MARSSIEVDAIADASDTYKIQLSRVDVSYDASKLILRDISLDVRKNELLCLIGASGSGKTTLLHVIAGLHPPTQGEVRVDDVVVTGPGPDRAMVFQEDAVFPWLTVRRNAEYGLRLKRMNAADRKAKVGRVLELVGLAGNEDLLPRQLSGGMRKRVDLARALAVEPQVLLMDEPYGSLDMMTKERLQMEFSRIFEETTMAVVFVTHDLEEALFLGDRVVCLGTNPGRIRAITDVPFPRPRSLDLKRTDEFQHLRGELALLLHDQLTSEQA